MAISMILKHFLNLNNFSFSSSCAIFTGALIVLFSSYIHHLRANFLAGQSCMSKLLYIPVLVKHTARYTAVVVIHIYASPICKLSSNIQ